MSINTVIFDLDGTLLDTIEDLADSVNYALEKRKLPKRTTSQVRADVGNGIRNLMIKSIPEGEKYADFESALSDFTEHYKANCKNKTRPYDGVSEMLTTLRKNGYSFAIVSNKADFAVKEVVSYYFGEFSPVAIGENEKAGIAKKPSPEMVFSALALLGADKSSAVYVGDSEVDVKTAENSGLPCVSVLWGFRTKEKLISSGAKTFINKPDELISVIKSIK